MEHHDSLRTADHSERDHQPMELADSGPRVDPTLPPSARPMDASIYAAEIDLDDDNDAHTLVARLVGYDKRVLELGCATGSATKVFQERGCSVTGIEIDPEAAQRAKEFADEVIVGDLDTMDVRAALGDATFDVIVAADVLEHLRDPSSCLQACLDHLAPGGEVVLSIPNVAHVDVRLALLRGEFEYQSWGLLDGTHLRFFTRRTLGQFLSDNGLVALQWQRTTRAPGDTEIRWEPGMDAGLVAWASSEPDADTYQFVVRGAVAPKGSHLDEVAGQRDAVLDAAKAKDAEIAALRARTEELERERAASAEARGRQDADHALRLDALRHEIDDVTRERDDYVASFSSLSAVEDQLVAVRRSESYRIGNALLSPMVTARRIVRAWKRAKR